MVSGGETQTLVLLCIRDSRGAQERNAQDIATTREPVLGFGEDSHAVAIFA